MSTERIAKCSITGAYSTNKMREVQIQLADGEVRDKVEHYEPFGFTSEMITDGKTDSVVVFTDESRGLGMVVCVADRRYRPTDLKPGEVCVYDKKGRKVYFKEDGIVVEGVDSPVTVNTSSKVIINASSVEINADTTINGNVTVNGNINSTGNMTGGTVSLQEHVHSGVQSGGSNTGAPVA